MSIKISLKGGGVQLRLPVTPASYTVQTGRNTATYDLIDIGEYTKPTSKVNQQYSFTSVLLPSHDRKYPSAYAATIADATPAGYQKQLNEWIGQKTALRFIVSGGAVAVNLPVYLISAKLVERDASGDVYADIVMVDRVSSKKQTIQEPTNDGTKLNTRASHDDAEAKPTSVQSYKVIKGDTLWAICRKYYNDGKLYSKLAAYNGIKNPDYIKVGQIIRIPGRDKL